MEDVKMETIEEIMESVTIVEVTSIAEVSHNTRYVVLDIENRTIYADHHMYNIQDGMPLSVYPGRRIPIEIPCMTIDGTNEFMLNIVDEFAEIIQHTRTGSDIQGNLVSYGDEQQEVFVQTIKDKVEEYEHLTYEVVGVDDYFVDGAESALEWADIGPYDEDGIVSEAARKLYEEELDSGCLLSQSDIYEYLRSAQKIVRAENAIDL